MYLGKLNFRALLILSQAPLIFEITPDRKANLEFGILAYPNDLVYVNGAKFNGSFPDNAGMPD